MDANAIWTVGEGRFAHRRQTLPEVGQGEVALRARFTGVSRGTEALVAAGAVPESEHAKMRAPLQEGDFPFPVKYGYAFVGEITAGPPDRIGQTCFVLHPHQDHAVVPAAMALPLPDGLPADRAVLGANTETALNILWDSGAAAGDRIVVIGAGVVGALVARLAAALPGAEVTLVDADPEKAGVAEALAVPFAAPDDAPVGADVVINASGVAAGLRLALTCAGVEATIVEASWHGSADVALPLGGAFHSQRLRLISSQVGAVPPARAPRWPLSRRLAKALGILARDPALTLLITHRIPFTEAPDRLPEILAPGAKVLCPLITYP